MALLFSGLLVLKRFSFRLLS